MRSWGDPSFFIGSIDEEMNGLFKIPPEFAQFQRSMIGKMKGD